MRNTTLTAEYQTTQDQPTTSAESNTESVTYTKFKQNGTVPGLYYSGKSQSSYLEDDDGLLKEETTSNHASTLPPEVLIEIFSHLPPAILDSCALVCRHWHEVLGNDASWRASFERIFQSKRFNRVTSSLKWRTELVSRLDYIHKWRKGTMKNVSFNGQIREISNVFPDLSSCRVVLFSTVFGAGVIADPTKGKLATPRIFTEKSMMLSSDLICVDGSRFGLIYGMADGKVCCLLFSQETRIHDYVVMKNYRHEGQVSAVWINKMESPRDNNNEKRQFFGALSGDMHGTLVSWDLEEGQFIRQYSLPSEEPITHIKCDHIWNKIVVATQAGGIYALFYPDGGFVKVGQFPLNTGSSNLSFFEVDFMAEYVVYANQQGIYRFKLTDNQEEMERAEFQMKGDVVTVAMDNTIVSEAGANKDTPGRNNRYLAASTDKDLIYVWVLQNEAVYDEQHKLVINPLRISPSPFQVEIPHLPSVTAIALNSLVLLVGAYNGVTIAYELLTGEFLRIVSTRFSKRALNLRTNPNFGAPGLFPISKLEIDPDPANSHGIIVVGSAVQYFDLGANIDPKKKLGVYKKRRGGPMFSEATINRNEINRNIESDLELMRLEDEEVQQVREQNQRLHEMYNNEELSEEDQLEYAMMLSRETEEQQQSSESFDNDEDAELKRAIEMSLAEESPSAESYEHYDEEDEEDDKELKQAMRLSLQQKQESQPSSSSQHAELEGIEDDDLKRAILLSLQQS